MNDSLVSRLDNLKAAMCTKHIGITEGKKKYQGKEIDHAEQIPLLPVLLTGRKLFFFFLVSWSPC